MPRNPIFGLAAAAALGALAWAALVATVLVLR